MTVKELIIKLQSLDPKFDDTNIFDDENETWTISNIIIQDNDDYRFDTEDKEVVCVTFEKLIIIRRMIK